MLRSAPSEYHGHCWAPPITLRWELCLSPPRSLPSLSAALTLLTPCHLGSCGGGGAHLSHSSDSHHPGHLTSSPTDSIFTLSMLPCHTPHFCAPSQLCHYPITQGTSPHPPLTLGPCSIRPVPGHSSVAGPSGQPASSPEPLAGTWGRGPPLGPCTWQSGVHVPSVERTPMGERDVGPRIPGVMEGGACCVRTGCWETAGWT